MAITGYSVTFHAYQGNLLLGDIPHAFVTISVPGQQPVVIGYYPVSTTIEAPGVVKNDALSGLDADKRPIPHRETSSRTFDVSPGQAEAMLAYAANIANDPRVYGVLGNQCTGFARDVLAAGGIHASSSALAFGSLTAASPHPGGLAIALSLTPTNQVQPWRSDGSRIPQLILSIYNGIAGNPARLQQYIESGQVPQGSDTLPGGYWFGAQIDTPNWSAALALGNDQQASALASIVVPIDVAGGPVPTELLALQQAVLQIARDSLPLLGGGLVVNRDSNGNVLMTGNNGLLRLDADGSSELAFKSGETVNGRSYAVGGGFVESRETYATAWGISSSAQDAQGHTAKTTLQTDDDGNVLEIVTKADGTGTAKAFDASGQLIKQATLQRTGGIDGATGTITFVTGGVEQTFNSAFSLDPLDGPLIQLTGFTTGSRVLANAALADLGLDARDLLLERGEMGVITQLRNVDNPQVQGGWADAAGGADWYKTIEAQQLGGSLTYVQSLMAAIKGEKPLPIASAVFGLGAHLSGDPVLSEFSGTLSAIGSLASLKGALDRGDAVGILRSGLGASQAVLTLYRTALDSAIRSAAASEVQALGEQLQQVDAALTFLGKGLAVVNLYQGLKEGDALSVASALATLLEAPPWVSWTIVAVQLLESIFHDYDIEGSGHFVSALDGRHVTAALTHDSDGGGAVVMNAMSSILGQLDKLLVEFANLGLVASRMPKLSYVGYGGGGGEFTLTWIEAGSGHQVQRVFGSDGKLLRVGAGATLAAGDAQMPAHGGELAYSDAFQTDVVGAYLDAVQASRAFAPTADVVTVDAQVAAAAAASGGTQLDFAWLAQAGMDTLDRARANGQLMASDPGNAAVAGASAQQTARPIVLDLDGDGITVTHRGQGGGGVLFDVDDDGYAEATDWVGPREGILVLDRNGDGKISGGHEMFSDSQVDMATRGLHALDEIDANGDGRIDFCTSITGNLLANDHDPDAADVLRVANAGIFAGSWGTLDVADGGSWVYTPRAAAQSLAAGQSAVDHFNIAVSDRSGSDGMLANSVLTLTLSGSNDAPTLAGSLPDASASIRRIFTLPLPAALFADVDQGDTLSWSAKLAGGQALPSWIAWNASTHVLTGTPPDAALGTSWQVEVAATDSAGAHVGTDFQFDINAVGVTLTGTEGPDALVGADLNDTLTGLGGSDLLDGAGGADQMAGGPGDDRYVVDDPQDSVVEAVNAGNDTVLSSISTLLGSNLENLVLIGADAINGSGNELANVLVGNAALNHLLGLAGNDVLAGGQGDDLLDGGSGDDLYLYNQGEGRDTIDDATGTDTLRFGAGITLDAVAARAVTVNGQARVFIAILGSDGTAQSGQGVEIAASAGIERFEFADGSVRTLADLMIGARTLSGGNGNDTLTGDRRDDTINGSNGNDILYGRWGHDLLDGGSGNDKLFGEGGNDTLRGGNDADELWGGAGDDSLDGSNGADLLVGGDGNDLLTGGNDNDRLDGGAGNDLLDGYNGLDDLFAGDGDDTLDGGNDNDVLAAGAGNDTIRAGNGRDAVLAGAGDDSVQTDNDNDFVDGGAGADLISTGSGADFIAAGKGNDTIDAGQDQDLLAFNRGDGADVVLTSSWQRDALSLGGGIRYADLRLSRIGTNLVIGLGAGDSITLRDWYLDSTRRNLSTLQVVTAATGGDYAASSTDRLRNQKSVSYDFEALANRFDQWRAANPGQTEWSPAAELNTCYLSGSNGKAIGGDLAWRYATSGSYGDIDARGVIDKMAGMSATTWQSLTASSLIDPWTALQAGTMLLADATVGLPGPITPVASPSSDELFFAAINASGHKPSWVGSTPPVLP